MRRIAGLVVGVSLVLLGCGGGSSDLNADAGDDFAVSVGEAPTFDGCGSGGDITNYQWTIVEAPGSQSDSNGKELRSEMDNCSFELESAMIIDDVGEWVIELAVTDGDGSVTDQVVVTVGE